MGQENSFQMLTGIYFASQDDIIDDVESFVAAAEILKERGAYKIFIMATHGLLSADAPRLIEESLIDEAGSDRLCKLGYFAIKSSIMWVQVDPASKRQKL